MTFTEIQSRVADICNITSTTGLARIGASINERYRIVASSIGLDTIERAPVTANTVSGNRSVTFTCEKILSLYNTAYTPVMVLTEKSFDTIRNQVVGTDPASDYAIQLMGASTVTIYLGALPSSIYALTADALVNLSTLSGSQIPAFAQDFHDILTLYAHSIELYKMEKYAMADKKQTESNDRLSDLRYYIQKSAFTKIVQGGRSVGPLILPMV